MAVLGFAVMLMACANEPIYDVRSHPVPAKAQTLSLDRIETAIIDAGRSRGWRMERSGPGKLRAAQIQPKFSAEVEIAFDAKSFSIIHAGSKGMNENNGSVHPHYNFWIRNLESDIDIWLTNAPLTK
ncbi:hypothetical protein CU669_16255 [Paramagnetospirillum kuznetsovii]|uniref:Lipoprotein n=1 Tax=Paramagnetospirillum kuznetsovii TaxID=2053833 RepID=A0A364NVA0_9PROT|nr:hypothetical protein [Paramagnetospirillum kuznetsovii]RAU20825.1 hypothetical protein CU669_16255 [Paramagnetospirillum kuznetsovii]